MSLQMQRALIATGQVDEALNRWLVQCISRRVPPDEIVGAIIQTGRSPELATMITRLAMDGLFITPNGDERVRRRSEMKSPDVPSAIQHIVDGGDRQIKISMTLDSLRVKLYDNFLSDEECEHLKMAVDGRLKRSKVVGQMFSDQESKVRTSTGAFIDIGATPMIETIEARIAKVSGFPVENGECLQVLHYANTEEYQPHFDFFEPQNEQEAMMLQEPGNRISTFIFYLNDVDEGGATYFPQLQLSIHPRKGSAVQFSYLEQDGLLDMRSEHAGLPVISGEKWIATKWLRERAIKQPPVRDWEDNQSQNSVGPGINIAPMEISLSSEPSINESLDAPKLDDSTNEHNNKEGKNNSADIVPISKKSA